MTASEKQHRPRDDGVKAARFVSVRIDFPPDDAALFNELRDEWRSIAGGSKLPKVSHKIASLLPGYVNRKLGYAYPTDQELAKTLKCSPRLIGRGMAALENAGLVDRKTTFKRDAKGEAIGRLRRIYLTRPQVNGTQREVNGTNRVSERKTVFRIYPDRTTPDKVRRDKRVSSYPPPRDVVPLPFGKDDAFLDRFDNKVMELTDGQLVRAGEIDWIVKEAFDKTTNEDIDLFMPFHWRDVCALRSKETQEWFLRRTSQLIPRMVA